MSNKDNVQVAADTEPNDEIEDDAILEVAADNEMGDPTVDETVIPIIGRKPRILVLDTETARMIVGAWRFGKQVVGTDQMISDSFVLGWAAKWLGQDTVMSEFVTSLEAKRRDDSRIIAGIWKLLDLADIVITHNGDDFDLPKLVAEFIRYGYGPTSPFASVDTCKSLRKTAGFSSNKLDFVAQSLLGRAKIKTGYDLWIACEHGDIVALAKMEQYCQNDVTLLEEMYLVIRPFIKNHPNVGIIINSPVPVCPVCGSTEIEEDPNGVYTTQQNAFATYRCASCGAVHRRRHTLVTSSAKAAMTVALAH